VCAMAPLSLSLKSFLTVVAWFSSTVHDLLVTSLGFGASQRVGSQSESILPV
jgi:hypothetical protein